MYRWFFIILLVTGQLFLTSQLLAEESVDQDIKDVIESIVNKEPFPVEVTDTRWVIDIDNELDLSKDENSFQLPEQLIRAIAIFSEYILWVVLIILLILAYLNRRLLNIEKIFARKSNHKVHVTEIETNNETVSPAEVMVKLSGLLTQKEYRRLTSLLYQSSINTLNDVSLFATETDIKDQVNGRGIEIEQFFNLLISLRVKLAYRHMDVEDKDIARLVTMWQSIYSGEKS